MSKLDKIGRLIALLVVLVVQSLAMPVGAHKAAPPDALTMSHSPDIPDDCPEVRLAPSPVDAQCPPQLQELGEAPKQPLLSIQVLVVLDTSTYGGPAPYYEGTNQMITGYLDILGIPYEVVDVADRAVGAVEPHPMGTAGALRLIDHLDEPFLLMNADLLTDLDFVDMVDFHLRHKAAITMTLYPREAQVDFGVIELDDTSHVIGLREKPH